MKFSEALPNTYKLWSEIREKTDTHKLLRQKEKLERNLRDQLQRKSQAETLTEFKAAEKEILEIEQQILGVETEMDISKFRYKEAIEEDVPKLLSTYNEEFKPYYNEYATLQKELDTQLKAFAKKVEPTVNRMKELEKLETQAHMLKTFGPQNNYSKYLKLPVDTTSFERSCSWYNGMFRTMSSGLGHIIKVIKNKK